MDTKKHLNKYLLFDHYDVHESKTFPFRTKKKIKKGSTFTIDDVTYEVTGKVKLKVVGNHNKRKKFKVKQIRYKIKNDLTTIVHHCPVKKIMMNNLKPKQLKDLRKKYGKEKIKRWQEKGNVKMHSLQLVNICPSCGVQFFKDKREMPKSVEVIALKDKVQLKKR